MQRKAQRIGPRRTEKCKQRQTKPIGCRAGDEMTRGGGDLLIHVVTVISRAEERSNIRSETDGARGRVSGCEETARARVWRLEGGFRNVCERRDGGR